MATGRQKSEYALNAPKHVRTRRRKRHAKLLKLGYQGYSDYLRSPHWKAIKAQYRQSELPQDCICGDPDVQLHHMTYARIGNERLTDLTPLCARCHSLIHVLEFRGEIELDFTGFFNEGRATEGREFLRRLAEEQERLRTERLQAQQREVLASSFAARLLKARRHARFRHVDVSGHIHVLKHMVKRGRDDESLTRQLRRIEEIAYGWEGWRDAA